MKFRGLSETLSAYPWLCVLATAFLSLDILVILCFASECSYKFLSSTGYNTRIILLQIVKMCVWIYKLVREIHKRLKADCANQIIKAFFARETLIDFLVWKNGKAIKGFLCITTFCTDP